MTGELLLIQDGRVVAESGIQHSESIILICCVFVSFCPSNVKRITPLLFYSFLHCMLCSCPWFVHIIFKDNKSS